MTYTNSPFRNPSQQARPEAPPTAVPTTEPLLTQLSLIGFALAVLAVMVWSSKSIITLTHDMNVSWWFAWIPAVATDGVMLVATGWCVNDRLDRTIRRYAAGIAVTGIVGSVAVAAIEHYVTAAHIKPPAELAALIGGIPSLMLALLIHVFAMIRAQQRRARAEQERAQNAARDAELAREERIRREHDAVTISGNEKSAAEAHARVRPLEIERETKEREARQRDLDRESAEREQIRVHASELARTAILARWLQAYVLAGKINGATPHQGTPEDSRNASPAPVTRYSPGAHQVGSPGPSPVSSPARHQVVSPASPGGSPGEHQPRPPARRQTPTASDPGSTPQVTPEIALMVDLAELWLEKNPGAGRTRLVKYLVNLVNEAGDGPGEPLVTDLVNHLVTRPGEPPGDRITDHTGKLVQAELRRREKQREIDRLERLLVE